jgi:acetoacetyl-CoA reductase/3-oxoacyl-[acyl-carrier protein] reductase
MNTILTGTFMCSQEFALRYKGSKGHIVNIGALTAIRGRLNGANYCSARAGVLTLTKCMALELAPKIRVNCVTPGFINTDEVTERYNLTQKDKLEQALLTIPLGKLGKPEDIFKMIYFIVSESNYITGQNFIVDGGKLMR